MARLRLCGISFVIIGLATCVLLLVDLHFISSSNQAQLPAANIRKDLSINSLVALLNSRHDIFKKWDSGGDDAFLRHYARFMEALTPWMISPPSDGPISLPFLSSNLVIDCSDPYYQFALSGERLHFPRVIVDFIPFGFDIDKLEIRLYENYHAVDAFIVFESTITQTGTPDLICLTFYYVILIQVFSNLCYTMK